MYTPSSPTAFARPLILALVASSSAGAGVISRTCDGALGMGGREYIDSALSYATPGGCTTALEGSFTEYSGGHETGFGGFYSVNAGSFQESAFSEGGSGFELDTTLSGHARVEVTSADADSGATGGVFMLGDARDSFSVGEQYAFTLEYSLLGTDASRSISRNFLDPHSGDETLAPLMGSGVISGVLLPGQTYHLQTSFRTSFGGSAYNGATEVYTGSWGGLSTQLKATAVPLPGAGMLLLPGLLMLGRPAWKRRRSRLETASSG